MQHLSARAGVALIALLGLVACSDGNNGESPKALVQGVVLSVQDGSPQPNREFQVIDLSTDEGNPKLTGVSDENGAFEFDAGNIKELIVLFAAQSSEPRSSGLVNVDDDVVMKELKDVTDIACQAGASAVGDGSIEAAAVTRERIENLEAAAAQVLAEGNVDFSDSDSVTAAANEVRSRTNDGANPPSTSGGASK